MLAIIAANADDLAWPRNPYMGVGDDVGSSSKRIIELQLSHHRTLIEWLVTESVIVGCAVFVEGFELSRGLVPMYKNPACRRQRASASEMVFSIPMLLSYVSHVMTLEPGDVVATGTPAGVGPIKEGDVVEIEIEGLSKVSNPVRIAI